MSQPGPSGRGGVAFGQSASVVASKPANRTLSTPRDRSRGIGLGQFAWKRLDRPCKRCESVGDTHIHAQPAVGVSGKDARALSVKCKLISWRRRRKKSSKVLLSYRRNSSLLEESFEILISSSARNSRFSLSLLYKRAGQVVCQEKKKKKFMNKCIKMEKLI